MRVYGCNYDVRFMLGCYIRGRLHVAAVSVPPQAHGDNEAHDLLVQQIKAK